MINYDEFIDNLEDLSNYEIKNIFTNVIKDLEKRGISDDAFNQEICRFCEYKDKDQPIVLLKFADLPVSLQRGLDWDTYNEMLPFINNMIEVYQRD